MGEAAVNRIHAERESEVMARKKAEFLKEFKRSLAIAKFACEAVGITRKQFYAWKHTDAEFAYDCWLIEEDTLDVIEVRLVSSLAGGVSTDPEQRAIQKLQRTLNGDIRRFLQAKARHRGYHPNVSINQSFHDRAGTLDSQSINIQATVEEIGDDIPLDRLANALLLVSGDGA